MARDHSQRWESYQTISASAKSNLHAIRTPWLDITHFPQFAIGDLLCVGLY